MQLKQSALTAVLSLSLLAACGQQSTTTLSAQGGNGKPPTGSSTAAAQVFLSNPVEVTGDQTLTDQKDSASAVPASAYSSVILTNLDGSGSLSGDYAKVASETGTPAYGTAFNFTRDQDQFEQVMAYFWVTEAQKYIQSLGFGSELPDVNKQQMDVKINQYGGDNSYQTDKPFRLRFGKGGVDDAEDGEVVVHEYGHAVHADQVPGFGGSLEAGSIGEAFGDYLAVTVGEAVQKAHGIVNKAPLACVADWDSTSYTRSAPHCLRRIDGNKHYPADMTGEVHADGEIWSRALFDIRTALGAYQADRIIINAQFKFAPDTSFKAAAEHTVNTALTMSGQAAAEVVKKAFTDRGILP